MKIKYIIAGLLINISAATHTMEQSNPNQIIKRIIYGQKYSAESAATTYAITATIKKNTNLNNVRAIHFYDKDNLLIFASIWNYESEFFGYAAQQEFKDKVKLDQLNPIINEEQSIAHNLWTIWIG